MVKGVSAPLSPEAKSNRVAESREALQSMRKRIDAVICAERKWKVLKSPC
jgi:hypothetical protein